MINLIYLALGVLAGGAVVYLVIRGKIAVAETQARCVGDVERTSLAEQLKALGQELFDTKKRLSETETDAEGFRAEGQGLAQQCAQLSERANRLTAVEETLNTASIASEKLKSEIADLRELNGRLKSEVATKQSRIEELDADHIQLLSERDNLNHLNAKYQAAIAELTTNLENERRQGQEKLALLTEAREVLSNQFKAVANEILDEKSKKFTEQNQANLSQLLDPLKEKLTAFQTKVEEVYVQESKDRSALGEQVRTLTQLNTSLSQDAQNLTLALKGDRKAQGNWGEIILEELLERAGLECGRHYDLQGGVKSEDGLTHVIPDVVIHLPADRHIVVDSKMTLPDYRAFASADDDGEREAALKRHLASTRAHMKGLCDKQYQTLYGLRSLDFVLMFFPLEPAFMLAVTNDRELFHDAWEKNVLVVSPSTLLFVIRTVANLWRQEDLSRNALEISRRGSEIHDKLVGFVTDLQEVGKRLDQAQDSFNDARRKLSDGRGNVIGQAKKLKDLGVKPTKTFPPQWADSSVDDTENPAEALTTSETPAITNS